MTHLRKMMLEELQRRNHSESTIRGYVRAVQQFAKHFGQPADKLGPEELRSYRAYLLKERKLAVGSVVARVAALRFFFVRTLKRHQFREDLPYPKDRRPLVSDGAEFGRGRPGDQGSEQSHAARTTRLSDRRRQRRSHKALG